MLRKRCYELAGYKCEICGDVGKKHPVECHEIWHYDDENHTQTLTGLIALCPDCHMCKHIGFASRIGKLNICVRHLMIVNEISRLVAEKMVDDAFGLWNRRSEFDWTINMDFVESLIAAAESARTAERKDSNNQTGRPPKR